MALRKNNQKDFDKFKNTSTDVLGNKKPTDPPSKTMAGESMPALKKDSKGKLYGIYGGEGSDSDWTGFSGMNAPEGSFGGRANTPAVGDTVFTGKLPVKEGDYLGGSDFGLSETDLSKQRKKGPKSYEVKTFNTPYGQLLEKR